MLSATTFTYDGVYSGQFGLLIASLDSESVKNRPILTPTLKTTKTTKGIRSSFAGVQYDENPPLQFTILSETDIPEILMRKVLSWLVGRNGFRPLQLHQPGFEDYLYNCIFTNVEVTDINGGRKGFTVTAEFDSPYCRGIPTKKTVSGDGTSYKVMEIANRSDIPDDYVYPLITVRPTGTFEDTDGVYKDICIKNISDDENRIFEFKGLQPALLSPTEELLVDGELKVISKREDRDSATNPIGDAMDCFNKNWVRLKQGKNRLEIKVKGEVTIEVPQYVLIGF